MKALTYVKAHALKDFAIRLQEVILLAIGIQLNESTEAIGFTLDRTKWPAALARTRTLDTLSEQMYDANKMFH